MLLTQRVGQSVYKDLLESDTIHIEKLKQYVQKNSIATEFKPLCWKILLGIKSPYRATRAYVDQANCDIFKRLRSTLTTCRAIHNDTPIAQQFLTMYLFDAHATRISPNATVSVARADSHIDPLQFQKEYESFPPIANFICSFLDNDNGQRVETTAECWLMTCKVYDKFAQLTRRLPLLVSNATLPFRSSHAFVCLLQRHHVGKIAQRDFVFEPKLLLHLNTHNIFAFIPENWLRDGFQLIRDDISLLKCVALPSMADEG